MSRAPHPLLRLTLCLALGLACAAAGFASPWGPPPRLGASPAHAAAVQPASAARVPVMVELSDPPAATDWAAALADKSVPKAKALANARSASKAKVAKLGPLHDRLGAALAAAPINAQELYRLKRVMNAIAVMVEPSKLDRIRALPGVKRVRVITPEYPTNATSVPFIGAPSLWDTSLSPPLPGNVTGTGIKIAVIDTGLDYQHPMFGGSGLLADYQANDRVTIHPGLFPTAKVVGGFDFAGDAYNGGNAPKPDPNPMDCFGHGTHVAGTAAGFGVKADGTTYTGPYGASSTPFSTLRIGPGVAPGALLYAIRIFGCSGSTGLTAQGIEFAVDPDGDGDLSDHVDVINMSLGAPFGGIADTSAQASQAAVDIGVIVVASQGNDGDTFFIGGSPASATGVIAAAASVDAGIPGALVKVNAPPAIAGNYAAAADVFGHGAPPPSGQTGTVVEVQSATGTPAQGCDPSYKNGVQLNGAIALIMRGSCGFQKKVANAQAVGAIGAIVFNNIGDPVPVNMGPDGVSPNITIPAVFVSLADGKTLAGATGVNATLLAANAGDTLAGFTSRGPRGGGSYPTPIALKPDVAAPGLAIPSAQSGITCTTAVGGCLTPSPTGFIPGGQSLTISGTSMAAPHTAGTTALLRELHPDWSVEEIKALLMNGAVHDITLGANGNGLKFGLGRIGAGRIDVPSSALNEVTAFNDDDPGTVTLAFDSPVVSSVDQIKQLRVVNHGSQAQTFSLGFDDRTVAPGVSFSLVDPSQASLTVPADSAITVPVQMKADATKMDQSADPTVSPTQTDPVFGLGPVPRFTLTEAGSYLDFGQGGATKLRVPVYAAPLPASDMAGAVPIPTGNQGAGLTAINLSGIGVCTGTAAAGQCNGNFPVTEASLVTPFELQAVHPLDPTLPGFANIQYAGVAYDAADDLVLFGISTWGPWSSPTDVSFSIYIDTQNNGTFDKVLFNSNPGTISADFTHNGGTAQDVFLTAFLDVPSGNILGPETFVNLFPASIVDTRVFGNNVILLAASPKDLGFKGTAFHWKVVTCPGFLPLCIEVGGPNFFYDQVSGPLSWDFAHQGLDFGGNFLAFDLNGDSLPLIFNITNFSANGSLGALLLHTHNTGGTQAQTVPLQGARWADVGVATSVSPATSPVKANATVTITVQATNAGPNKARQVVVFDSLPSGLAYVSDDSGGAYDPNLGLWTVGQLGVGASATLHIKATVIAGGEIVNTAQLASSKPIDPNPENDVASVTLNAPRLADLAVTAKASPSSIHAGQAVTFTVTLTNNGGDPSYNPRVHVILGGGKYDLAHISTTDGSFDPGSGMWQLGSVASGATETLTFRVLPLHGGSVGINVFAFASTSDPNLLNNHAHVSVPIH